MAVKWEVDRWVRCGAQRPQGSTGTKDSKDAHNASLPTLRSYASPWDIGHFQTSLPEMILGNGYEMLGGLGPVDVEAGVFGSPSPIRIFALSPFSKLTFRPAGCSVLGDHGLPSSALELRRTRAGRLGSGQANAGNARMPCASAGRPVPTSAAECRCAPHSDNLPPGRAYPSCKHRSSPCVASQHQTMERT